jgi:glucokinase
MAKKKAARRKVGRTLYAGVDIGGTKLHTVVARANGKILGRARKKTKGELGFAGVMARVVACVEAACKEAGISPKELRAVGVGAPSAMTADGVAVHAPNLGWRRTPVAAKLRSLLGRPVVGGNDCDVGTLGEYVFGAGKGSRSLVGLLVGTGLGGGIVYHGALISGENHLAAEVGHMTVQVDGRLCSCGHRGCLEAYASKSGMGRRFAADLEAGRQSVLATTKGIDLANVRSGVLLNAYRSGDGLVRDVLAESARYLGIGIANLVTLLGPDTVVIGGGVYEALGKNLLPLVKAAAKKAVWPPASYKDTRIVLSALGDDAVALGALAYAHQRFQ